VNFVYPGFSIVISIGWLDRYGPDEQGFDSFATSHCSPLEVSRRINFRLVILDLLGDNNGLGPRESVDVSGFELNEVVEASGLTLKASADLYKFDQGGSVVGLEGLRTG
jgi:hypothetical protein